jgi:hypothetical protein
MAMLDQPFREPVLLYWEHSDGQVRPTLIQSPREAFKALTRGVRLPIASAEYQIAFDKIVRALLDPKPETIEAARGALHRLANTMAGQDPRRTLH